MDDENFNGHWHLSKTLNVSHIFTTLTVLIGALSAYFNMDSRIALLEDSDNDQQDRIIRILERQAQTDARQDVSIRELSESIQNYNQDIISRLDRLINNSSGR